MFIALIIFALSGCNFWGNVEQTVSVSQVYQNLAIEKWEWTVYQADRIQQFTTTETVCTIELKREESFFVLVRPEGGLYEFTGVGKNMPDSSILHCTARGGEIYSIIRNVILQGGSIGAINHTRLMQECRKLELKRNRAVRVNELATAIVKQHVSSRSFKLAPLVSFTIALPSGEYIPLNPVDDPFTVYAQDEGALYNEISLNLGEGLHRFLLNDSEVWIHVSEDETNVVLR